MTDEVSEPDASAPGGRESADPRSRAAAIRERVEPPAFPDRTVDVTEYGAAGDGETDCTDAFADAVAACADADGDVSGDADGDAGGGRVHVPPGAYRTGAIHLRDGVELHLAADATLAFSRDPADYLPPVRSRYEGLDVINYSPFVYAADATDVAITGEGTLDGRADDEHWWDWSGGESPNEYDAKDRLSDLVESGAPLEERTFGDGHFLRPPLVQFIDCQGVLVEGVTLTNSPMWHLHPVASRNVTVREVTIDTPRGSNTDGCNPESSTDVHVHDCTFATGDDCLSFKAGKRPDGPSDPDPCRNAVVERCEMADGNGGVVVGSETTGGVENVVALDCEMDSPNLKRALRLKSNPERGGFIRDVAFVDVTAEQVGGSAVEVTLDYANVREGDHPPAVTDIHVEGFEVASTGRVLNLIGTEAAPVGEVRLSDCRFEEVRATDTIEHVERVVFEDVTI